MKRLLFLSLMMVISITSAACGADKFFGPTFTPTPTETLTPTDTTTITPTPTETPTPEFTDGIVPAYTETIDTEVLGAEIHVQLITDKTVTENQTTKINEISLDPQFVNSKGEHAPQAVADLVAHAVFRAWQRNSPGDQFDARQKVAFETYMKMVAECQAGTRDWKDVEYQAVADDLTTPAYDLSMRTFRSGDPVSIVFVDANSPQFNSIMTLEIGTSKQYTGLSLGTEAGPNGELRILANALLNLSFPTEGPAQTAILLNALERLSWSAIDQGRNLSDPRDHQEFFDAFTTGYANLVIIKTAAGFIKGALMVVTP
jgi:hypothetical protein